MKCPKCGVGVPGMFLSYHMHDTCKHRDEIMTKKTVDVVDCDGWVSCIWNEILEEHRHVEVIAYKYTGKDVPVKLIDAHKWQELMEWVEKARGSFSDIEAALRLLRHGITADAIHLVMAELNKILPEETK